MNKTDFDDNNSCGECQDDRCKRFGVCVAMLNTYDIEAYEYQTEEGKNKLRIIRPTYGDK